MKKTFVSSAALLALLLAVGTVSTGTNAYAQTTTTTTKTTKKSTVTAATIPPPACPMNDPNGCGIYD